MFWHYHGRNMKAWEVPVQEILKEFHELVKGSQRGRQPTPTQPPPALRKRLPYCGGP